MWIVGLQTEETKSMQESTHLREQVQNGASRHVWGSNFICIIYRNQAYASLTAKPFSFGKRVTVWKTNWLVLDF